MKIKAKFKGADGSMGYRNGENYHLQFTTRDAQTLVDGSEKIIIWRTFPDGRMYEGSLVPYTSLKSFLNNWQVFN